MEDRPDKLLVIMLNVHRERLMKCQHRYWLFNTIITYLQESNKKRLCSKYFGSLFWTQKYSRLQKIQNSEGSDGEDTEEDSYLNADLGLKFFSG